MARNIGEEHYAYCLEQVEVYRTAGPSCRILNRYHGCLFATVAVVVFSREFELPRPPCCNVDSISGTVSLRKWNNTMYLYSHCKYK